VFVCKEAFCSMGGASPSLNLPEFLQLDIKGKHRGNKFDAIQHLTVATYVRHELLHYLYRSSIGRASPIEVLGALSQWPVAPKWKECVLSLFVPGLASLNETAWTTKFAQEPRLLHNSMANLTGIELLIDFSRPSQPLAARLDTSGQEHHELTQGRRWLTLLQAASNLRALLLRDVSDWSAGFDNLLHLLFESATWPSLTELSSRRDQNIGLLPFAPQLFDYSLGWYLFLQRDLDTFLVRHKNTLETLVLRNITGLAERLPPAPVSLQWLEPGFPPDPKPSLVTFERSLRLWRRELRGLGEADVVVAVEFYGGRDAAVERWVEGSEVRALAERMGVVPVDPIVARDGLEGELGGSSGVEFNWGGLAAGTGSGG
jgi:hypothetical protein